MMHCRRYSFLYNCVHITMLNTNPVLMWHVIFFSPRTVRTQQIRPESHSCVVLDWMHIVLCDQATWMRSVRSVRTGKYHYGHHFQVSAPWQNNNGGRQQQWRYSDEGWRNQLLTWYWEPNEAKSEGTYQNRIVMQLAGNQWSHAGLYVDGCVQIKDTCRSLAVTVKLERSDPSKNKK